MRNVNFAELPHAFLALLVQQFAFARGVAAVALGGGVLAEDAHGLARNNFGGRSPD